MPGRIAPGGGWRRAWGAGRGTGRLAALDVGEDLVNNHRVFDAGVESQCAAAVFRGLDVDPVLPLETVCAGHGLGVLRLGRGRMALSLAGGGGGGDGWGV